MKCFIRHVLKAYLILDFSFRFADKICVGDEVLVEGYDDFKPAKVINNTMFTMLGKYL